MDSQLILGPRPHSEHMRIRDEKVKAVWDGGFMCLWTDLDSPGLTELRMFSCSDALKNRFIGFVSSSYP